MQLRSRFENLRRLVRIPVVCLMATVCFAELVHANQYPILRRAIRDAANMASRAATVLQSRDPETANELRRINRYLLSDAAYIGITIVPWSHSRCLSGAAGFCEASPQTGNCDLNSEVAICEHHVSLSGPALVQTLVHEAQHVTAGYTSECYATRAEIAAIVLGAKRRPSANDYAAFGTGCRSELGHFFSSAKQILSPQEWVSLMGERRNTVDLSQPLDMWPPKWAIEQYPELRARTQR